MPRHAHARPIGGPLLDRTMITLLALFGIAEAVIGARFVTGLGPVSNMNDGYAWGIWEPVNVVVFTGIGAGAYSVGLLCYLLNKGQYHPLVRPAVLLAAIAYSLGGASIVVALGRPWNIWLLALPPMWNLSSVMLEVAVCVCAYVCVLWIEMLPAVLETAAESASQRLSERGRRWGGKLAKAMPYVIALAMLLPTMHQSSLGGLMIVAGPKLHPLWQTAFLPLLALISCLSMGLGAVVLLTALMGQGWKAKQDQELLVDMCRIAGGLLLLWVGLRMADLAWNHKLHFLGESAFYLFFFVLELGLFVGPAWLFLTDRVGDWRIRLLGAAGAVLGAALWRVDTFLTCYNAGEAWTYWPSAGELAVTVGMAAIGVAVFITISKLFPVVPVEEPPPTSVPASVAAWVLAFPAAGAAAAAPAAPPRGPAPEPGGSA